VRVDSSIEVNAIVGGAFHSLLAKLIARASLYVRFDPSVTVTNVARTEPVEWITRRCNLAWTLAPLSPEVRLPFVDVVSRCLKLTLISRDGHARR
jgi:hypothetical protein